jgi:hypothetical protein
VGAAGLGRITREGEREQGRGDTEREGGKGSRGSGAWMKGDEAMAVGKVGGGRGERRLAFAQRRCTCESCSSALQCYLLELLTVFTMSTNYQALWAASPTIYMYLSCNPLLRNLSLWAIHQYGISRLVTALGPFPLPTSSASAPLARAPPPRASRAPACVPRRTAREPPARPRAVQPLLLAWDVRICRCTHGRRFLHLRRRDGGHRGSAP